MKLSDILGFSTYGARTSAHEVHYETITYSQNGRARHAIFKKNKYAGIYGEQSSELEACFTAIANLFCAPHRMLTQDIVTDDNGAIAGVCSEHAAHALLKMRAANPSLVFMQATKPFQSTSEVSRERFLEWLDSYEVPLIDVVPHDNLKGEWADASVGEKFTKKYNERLQGYWDERKRIGDLLCQQASNEDMNSCIAYAQKVLERGGKSLGEIPEYWQPMSELLKKVFQFESLKRQLLSDPLARINIQQEIDIDTFGAGKIFHFLDKLPQNFFARLMEQNGRVHIDMDSLADVFATAYGLEEDDLHKGNIGFYVTRKSPEAPLCFHFFKIDHDLMFSDKVMAARAARFANLAYSSWNFRITPRDLMHFPDLLDSGNYYWPTKKTMLGVGDKAYQSDMDREAYKKLESDPQFQAAKWLRFLKQAVMPHGLVIKALEKTLELPLKNTRKASTLAIVQRATASRTSELRIALLEVPAFKEYLWNHHNEASDIIRNELEQQSIQLGCTQEEREAYAYDVYCALAYISDSLFIEHHALQIAVITRTYRCYGTARYFSKYLNACDEQSNKTALDHAIGFFSHAHERLKNNAIPEAERKYYVNTLTYYADVICDLDSHQAKCHFSLDQYRKILALAQAANSLSNLPVVRTLDEYKQQLDEIRSRPMNTLKQDKVLAVALLEKADFTNKEDLVQLNLELSDSEPQDPSLKFIKELRSELWIIKKIRGVYGTTTTSNQMKHCISRKLRTWTVNQQQNQLDVNDPPDSPSTCCCC